MFSLLGEIFIIGFFVVWQIIKATWWFVLPIFVFSRIKPLYFFYKKIKYAKSLEWTLLEIDLPPEVPKTPKAMENVFAGIHGVWSPISKRAEIKGEFVDQFSMEMAGTAGLIKFYVRCQRKQRNFVESKIYAQYPDAEIREVEDYTENLPGDIPARDYDLWGAEFTQVRDWPYPIKTYLEFEDIEEERRLDPVSQFAELISKLEDGEHFWMQLVIAPVLTEADVSSGSSAISDKLIGRKSTAQKQTFLDQFVEFIFNFFRAFFENDLTWSAGGGGSSEEISIQRLTPGEQDALKKVEIKAHKLKFRTTMRAMYIGRKDVYSSQHIAGLQGNLRQFSGLNSFRPAAKSFPSGALVFFKGQRNYLTKRRLFNAYKGRFMGYMVEPMILDIEELATVFHFPGRVVRAPFMPRVSSKTSEPPRGLPT